MVRQKYKRSRQRERILSILQNTDRHPTASWLYDELKKEFNNLSMGTVYRNLNILVDQNLVKRIEAGSGFDRFDAKVEAHYHFICNKCGAIDDLSMAFIEELNKIAEKETGYQVESHRLDFHGLCPGCQEKTAD